MKTDVQNKLFAYWNVIRSAVAHDDGIAAIVLIDEIKKRFQDQNSNASDDELYISLLESADKLNIRNPFRDKGHFILVYKSIEQVQHADLEELMAQILSSSKEPLIPKALAMVYADRFAIHPQTVLITEAEKFVPNSHAYDLFDGTEYETWTVLQFNRDWAALEEDWLSTSSSRR